MSVYFSAATARHAEDGGMKPSSLSRDVQSLMNAAVKDCRVNQTVIRVRELIRTGRIFIPRDDDLIREYVGYKYKVPKK